MVHFTFQLSPKLFSLAWRHINHPSMTALRLVHFSLQQVVQGCLKRCDLEKLILSRDLMLHLQNIVFMIIHGVVLVSCLYNLINQCPGKSLLQIALLKEHLQSTTLIFIVISSNPPHFLFHFHFMEFFFPYLLDPLDLWFV